MRVRRMQKRGQYDRATIDAILDSGVLCHVGFVAGGSPIVIPTLYWREGDFLYLHGSVASRMLGESLESPICVAVTHLDGFVLTRSAFHHSVNYRSVVVLGRAEEIPDPEERAARMRYFMEGLFPGRWDALRPVKGKELKATRLLRLRIDEASAKIRSGPPADDKADLDWPAWGGVIPVSLSVGKSEPDAHVKDARLPAPRLGRRLQGHRSGHD